MTTHNRNEELVLAHFEAHATDEQKQAVKAAGKTPAGAMAYAYEQARALPRTGSCVAVDDATVFAWTMRYFTDAAIPADPDRSPAVQPNPPAEVKEPPAAKTRKPGTRKKAATTGSCIHPGTRSQTQTLRCFRGKFFVAFAKRIAQSGKGV